MGHNEVDVITRVLEAQHQESQNQFSELRESTAAVANAVAGLTTTIARVEERHASHDDGLKRVGKQVDDHEKRIRVLELESATKEQLQETNKSLKEVTDQSLVRGAKISTSWKAITIIGGVAAFFVSGVFTLISIFG